jgi:hypothetical protein
MAKHKKKTSNDELKAKTALYAAIGAWAIPATTLIEFIKFIIRRYF